MKKTRILALMMCLMMCLSVVAGCNLITRNDKAYFEATVATIVFDDGTKDEIKKRELLMGYNSYGYNYEQNYGQTRKEAIKTTLDSIIDQHLTIKAVKDYYAAQTDPEEKKLFNDRETTYLWDTTYNSIYGNLLSYYEEVTGTTTPTAQEADSTTNNLIYNEYSKKVDVEEDFVKVPKVKLDENGDAMKGDDGKTVYETDEEGNLVYETVKKLVLKTRQTASTIRDNEKNVIKRTPSGEVLNMESESGDSKDYMYQCFAELFAGKDKESRNWKSAFNKYIADVKKNYTYIKFKNDEECFKFELNRVYEIMRDNYIVQKYSEIYNQTQHQDANIANVSVENILEYYSSKARADYETYKNDRAGFDSKVLTDVANLEYIYEGNDQTDFFYVGYVKMNFDETLQKKYDDAQKAGDRKEEQLDEVYGSVYATERDSKGEKTSKTITASKLLENLESALKNRSQEEKVNTLRDYLYTYSDDDTLKNAEFNTVVGVNSKGEAVLPSTFADNEDAKEAILKLYNDGNKVGDISGLVRATDGIYIFFNAGQVKNLFDIRDEKFDASVNLENIKTLATTQMNIFSNKTYLDKLYDELSSDKFYIFQNMNIQNLRRKTQKIEAIENNIKDLY